MDFNKLNLESKVLDDINKSGWSPNRKFPIHNWKEKLYIYGLEGHYLADEILGSLGGLTIGSVVFNPTIETSLTFEELNEVNDESNSNFFPIGIKGEVMLTLDENGRIFGMLSDIVLKYGNNLEESINMLLKGDGDIESLGWEYDNW